MAKKQVAVSLRKPPSPEKVDAFVTAGTAEKASADSHETKPEQALDAKDAKRADVSDSSAPKADALNGEANSAPVTDALAIPQEPAVTPVLIGTDGRARRAFTVYLPDSLADRMVLHCIEQDRDMSNFVGEAVLEQLEKRLGPATSTHVSAAANEARDPAPVGGAPYRSETPFRHSEPPPSQTKVDRFFQVSRVLVTLWRQRPWG